MTQIETWRLLDLEYEDPYMNMAVEEAIPRIVGFGKSPSTIRLWRNPNAVVIGRFQKEEDVIDHSFCIKHHVEVVRRHTGGGAVYQDLGNLNYAISLPKDHHLIQRDVLKWMRTLSRGVEEGLRILGLKAEYEPNGMRIRGRKITGLAGSIKWGTVFLHGTLLVSSNVILLSKSLKEDINQVTTLRNELRRNVSIKEVKTALVEGFERVYAIRLVKGTLVDEERDLVLKLYDEKYSKDDWNRRR